MNELIGVVGAGLMGAEVALVFAIAGHDVLLNDRDEANVTRAIERLRVLMQKGVGRGLYAEETIAPTLGRIHPSHDLAARRSPPSPACSCTDRAAVPPAK